MTIMEIQDLKIVIYGVVISILTTFIFVIAPGNVSAPAPLAIGLIICGVVVLIVGIMIILGGLWSSFSEFGGKYFTISSLMLGIAMECVIIPGIIATFFFGDSTSKVFSTIILVMALIGLVLLILTFLATREQRTSEKTQPQIVRQAPIQIKKPSTGSIPSELMSPKPKQPKIVRTEAPSEEIPTITVPPDMVVAEPVKGKNTLVVFCATDWDANNIKQAIEEFCKGYMVGGPITLTEVQPHVLQAHTGSASQEGKFYGESADYSGTLRIGVSPTQGWYVQIDFEQGDSPETSRDKIYWEGVQKGLAQVLSNPLSRYQ